MITRKGIIVFGTILLTVLVLTTLITIGYYGYSLRRANYEHYVAWYNDEYMIDRFIGNVKTVIVHKDFYIIVIEVEGEEDRVYRLCDEIIYFHEGDIIEKKMNNQLFLKKDNIKTLINVKFCKY